MLCDCCECIREKECKRFAKEAQGYCYEGIGKPDKKEGENE